MPMCAGVLFGPIEARGESIERCGDHYRYYDMEFMRRHASAGCLGTRSPRAGWPFGYTVSTTPPGKEATHIIERYTMCEGAGPPRPRIISRGRKIPRYKVKPKPYALGNYIKRADGTRIWCKSVRYTPPSTAKRPATPQDEPESKLTGVPRVLNSGTIVVNNTTVRLYGVRGAAGEHAKALTSYIAGRPVECQRTGAKYRCTVGGVDLSEVVLSKGGGRADRTATPELKAAEAKARGEGLGIWKHYAARERARHGTQGGGRVAANACSRHRSPNDDPNILAEFRDKAVWRLRKDFTDATAVARVGRCNDGTGYFRIEVFTRSSAFKLFGEPHAAIVVTDATGQVLGRRNVTALSMGSSRRVGDKRRKYYGAIDGRTFDQAAYAFFRFKFCTWRQGFDRGIKENNGCYKSSLNREYRALTKNLPGRIGALKGDVGKSVEFLGWQVVRLR